MSNDAVRLENNSTGNGVYAFDSGVFWLCLILAIFGGIGFGIGSIFLFRHPQAVNRLLVLMYPLFTLGLVAFAINISRYRGRTIHITDDGISVHDRRGNQIEDLHWIELGNVTERRRLGQLVLWDKSHVRRVFVDQQYENFFKGIRSRIFDEYARVFVPKPLPMEFENRPFLLETFVLLSGILLFGWMLGSFYKQRQFSGVILCVGFLILTLSSLLKLYPQIRGRSILYEDRIVLRGFFKTEELRKTNVSSIEIQDIANRGGTMFSVVIVKAAGGKDLKITSKYGSIPEIYLSLRAWLSPAHALHVETPE
jgi:hypothetical protein